MKTDTVGYRQFLNEVGMDRVSRATEPFQKRVTLPWILPGSVVEVERVRRNPRTELFLTPLTPVLSALKGWKGSSRLFHFSLD